MEQDIKPNSDPTTGADGTDQMATGQTNNVSQNEANVDYKAKFAASTREEQKKAQRVKELEAELAAERQKSQQTADNNPQLLTHSPDTPTAHYPGYEDLDDDERKRLENYTGAVINQTVEKVSKSPEMSFAKQEFNKNRWNDAFNKVIDDKSKEDPRYEAFKDPECQREFRQRYFDPNVVPDNIENVLTDVAAAYLFNRETAAAKPAQPQGEGVQLESPSGAAGNAPPVRVHKTFAQWSELRRKDPKAFASQYKEYTEDLKSGQI